VGPKESELAKIRDAASDIKAQGEDWEAAAARIDALVASVKSTKNDLGLDWEGEGADAAFAAMDRLTSSLTEHAKALRKVKSSLDLADTAVTTAQTA